MNVTLFYPGHATSTIDVATGLEGGLRACGVKVRTFEYHDVLSFYYVALQAWEARNPEFKFDEGKLLYLGTREAISDVVEHPPDAVVMVTGLVTHKTFYDAMHRLGVPVVLILTESPYLDDIQLDLCKAAKPSFVFTNEAMSTGKLKCDYLPHSYDPRRHTPKGEKYECDVVFIGTVYPERRALLDSVDWTGIDVKFIGPDVQFDATHGTPEMADKNRIENSEAAKWYRGAKICLNLNRTVKGRSEDGKTTHIEPGEAWSLGPRPYEVSACGGFQLSDNTRGELEDVYKGHVPTFETGRELERLVRHYLENDEERQRLARLQQNDVRYCTFEERARSRLLPVLEELQQRAK